MQKNKLFTLKSSRISCFEWKNFQNYDDIFRKNVSCKQIVRHTWIGPMVTLFVPQIPQTNP